MIELIKSSDPRLKEQCPEFNFETGYVGEDGTVIQAKELYELLRDKMIENKGVGLSACQLGIMTRAFVIGNPGDSASIIGVFNPMIVDYGDTEVVYEEGCLTYPGLFIKLKRAHRIRVRYRGWNGEAGTELYEGYTARVFLHEYDHLNGITFNTRATRFHLEQARNAKNRMDRKLNKLKTQRAS
jgi:peptide deformylase